MAPSEPIGFWRRRRRFALVVTVKSRLISWEDARLLEYHLRMQQLERVVLDPPLAGRERLSQMLYEAASKSGGKSLGQNVGELAVGRAADFIAIDLDDLSLAGASPETLVTNVVFSLERTAVKDVYVGGRCVVAHGRHPLQESVVGEFGGLQKSFWG